MALLYSSSVHFSSINIIQWQLLVVKGCPGFCPGILQRYPFQVLTSTGTDLLVIGHLDTGRLMNDTSNPFKSANSFSPQHLSHWDALTSYPWLMLTLSKGYGNYFRRHPSRFKVVKMTVVRGSLRTLAKRQSPILNLRQLCSILVLVWLDNSHFIMWTTREGRDPVILWGRLLQWASPCKSHGDASVNMVTNMLSRQKPSPGERRLYPDGGSDDMGKVRHRSCWNVESSTHCLLWFSLAEPTRCPGTSLSRQPSLCLPSNPSTVVDTS